SSARWYAVRSASMRPLSTAAGTETLAPPSPKGSASTGSSSGAPGDSAGSTLTAPSDPANNLRKTIAATATTASTGQTGARRCGASADSWLTSARLEAGRIELLLHRAQHVRHGHVDRTHLKARDLDVGRFVRHPYSLDATPLEIVEVTDGQVLILERAQ